MINHILRSIVIIENRLIVAFILKPCKYTIKFDMSRFIPVLNNVNIFRDKPPFILILFQTFFTSGYISFKTNKSPLGRAKNFNSFLSTINNCYFYINLRHLYLINYQNKFFLSNYC